MVCGKQPPLLSEHSSKCNALNSIFNSPEFVVGSRLCSERFFSGYSGFPLSSKTNISKFQFDLESVPN